MKEERCLLQGSNVMKDLFASCFFICGGGLLKASSLCHQTEGMEKKKILRIKIH